MHVLKSTIRWALVVLIGLLAATAHAQAFSDFRNGDLVFQTTRSKQSYAIMWASKSVYSHVGLIERQGNAVYVLEAVGRVSRTPLATWLAHGRMRRFTVYRDPRLAADQQANLVQAARQYLGRPYDLYFTSGNRAIYCSELVALAYQALHVPVGRWQKVSELDVDNPLVRKLVRSRWRQHPKCQKMQAFEDCWRHLQQDELITPAQLAEDARLQRVYSNYPL